MTTQELYSVMDVARAGNELASSFKEFGVKQLDPHFDIPPHLVGFRGENGRAGLAFEVICDDVDRDKGLQAAYLLSVLDCQAIAVTFDAHVTSSPINPSTGKEWERGEMQRLCDGEGACDTGLLTDCLATTALASNGEVAIFTHAYHWHEATREVGWVPNPAPEDADKVSGYVIDSLRHLQTRAVVANTVLSGAANRLGLDALREVRAFRDAATLSALAESAGVVRVSPSIAADEEARAVLDAKAVSQYDNLVWMQR